MRRPALCLLFLIPVSLPAQTSASVAILEGDVVNAATNVPIAKARVRLSSQLEPIYGKVDSQGHFALGSLRPGFYPQFMVEAPGFLPANMMGIDLRDPSLPARVMIAGKAAGTKAQPAKFTKSMGEDGAIHGTVSVELTPQAVITGRVTDPYGHPILSCMIELLTRKSPGTNTGVVQPGSNLAQKISVQTGDLGEYRISGLEAGTYWMVANKGNGALARSWESSFRITYYPSATSLDGAKSISIAAGQTVQADMQIVRQSGVRLAGKLIKPPGVQDTVVDVPGSAPRSSLYTQVNLVPKGNALMNANGPFATGSDKYEIADVMPGQYTLVAVTRDLSTDRFGPNQKVVAGLTREVEIGQQDMPAFDLQMEPLHDLSGEVVFGEGCKAAPLEIRAFGQVPLYGGDAHTTTGADGKFVLTGLTAGRFQITTAWAQPPGVPLKTSSIRLGDRDVQADGIDAPYSGNDILRIAVECSNSGRRQ
jgi:hypothetical protein